MAHVKLLLRFACGVGILFILAGCSGSGSGSVAFFVAPTHSISGTISPVDTGAGAVVTLSGPTTVATNSNSSGSFRFSGLAAGNYTISASKPGIAFSPANRSVVINGADVGGVDFHGAIGNTNLTIDGTRSFQTIDGMGMNINVGSWRGGELQPALDLLVEDNGSWLFRVIRDPLNWIADETVLPALHALEPKSLGQVYEAPEMQDIWNTIGYLNRKGVGGDRIILHFMGWTPTWLGGGGGFGQPSAIAAGKESELATMIASLVYYGRKVKGLDFRLLAPLNEIDWNCLEGPCVDPRQYAAFLRELSRELDLMGLDDIRFVGPDTAGDPGPYITAILSDSTVADKVDHLGFHSYEPSTPPGQSHPGKNYWLTERAAWCPTCDSIATAADEWSFTRATASYFLEDLRQGYSALLLYDGYDSYYYHHNSFSYWGVLAYDRNTGKYTPRKRFFASTQINRFIPPGSVRISTTTTAGVTVESFSHRASGKLAVVGQNPTSSDVTLFGQLQNLPGLSSLALYETNLVLNMQKVAEVPVVDGAFAVTIPADTLFSLSN